jgi:hypothetical protein
MEAGVEHDVHCVTRVRERDADMEEERPARRVGDDRTLVADDRIVESRLLEVRPHRAEHPSGHDDHVRAGVANGAQGRTSARPQHTILADQGPVEIEREGGDLRRKSGGELYGLPPVAVTTYAATSAICWVESW